MRSDAKNSLLERQQNVREKRAGFDVSSRSLVGYIHEGTQRLEER